MGGLTLEDPLLPRARYEYEYTNEVEENSERTELFVDEMSNYKTIKSDDQSERYSPTLRTGTGVVSRIRAHTGVIFATIAATCYAAYGAFVYVMSKNLDTFQIGAMTILYQLVGSVLLMVINREPPPRNAQQWLWTIPGGVLVAGANYLYTFSCGYMIMSDATAISQVSIVFMGILSCLILKDPFNVVHFLLALLALVGVICIAHPTYIFGSKENHTIGESTSEPETSPEGSLLGPLFAVGSALCEAPSFIFLRKQTLVGVDLLQSTFVTALTIEVLSVVLCTALGGWKAPTAQEWAWSCGAGVSYLATYVFLYMALERETVTLVSIVLNFQLIVAFILQLFLFSDDPQLTSWIGALLVTVACVGTLVKSGDQS